MLRSNCTLVLRRLGRLLSVLCLCGATASDAAVFRAGEDVVVESHEVIEDDLIAAGGTIRIDGVVQGDLVAWGGKIIVNGRVESNLIAAGGEITVLGSVGADVMAAGGTIVIDGEVADDSRISGYALHLGENAELGDDLFAAGFSLEARPESRVNGSVHFGGYQALLSGRILESLAVGAAALEIRGSINGNVEAGVGQRGQERPPDVISFFLQPPVEIPDVPSGFTIGESARIGGDLNYSSGDEAAIASGAKIVGEVRFDESERERGSFRVPNIGAPVRRLVTLVVIGLALLWMAPDWVGRVSRTLQERPLPSLAWGSAVTAGIAVSAAVIGALTALAVGVLGGVTLGGLAPPILGVGLLLELALLTPFLIIALYLPPILLGSIAGHWMLKRYRPDWLKVPAAPLTAGLALYVIARALPLIGGLVFAGGALLGLGALAIWIRDLSSGEPRKASA